MKTAIKDVLNNDLSRLVLAVLLIGGTLILLIMRLPVPDALWGFDGLAVGFFFGGLVSGGNKV